MQHDVEHIVHAFHRDLSCFSRVRERKLWDASATATGSGSLGVPVEPLSFKFITTIIFSPDVFLAFVLYIGMCEVQMQVDKT